MSVKGKGAVEAGCVIHRVEEGYRMFEVNRDEV